MKSIRIIGHVFPLLLTFVACQEQVKESPIYCGIIEEDFCSYVSNLPGETLVEADAWYDVSLDSEITSTLYMKAVEEMQPNQEISDTESGQALNDYLNRQMKDSRGQAESELLALGVEIITEYQDIPIIYIRFQANKIWQIANISNLTVIYGEDFQGTAVVTE